MHPPLHASPAIAARPDPPPQRALGPLLWPPCARAQVHALMNYASVVKREGKPQSAMGAFQEALSISRESYGERCSGEQV